jgi:hypothetical protein
MSFVLFDVLNAQKLADIQQYSEATEEMQRAILEEAGKMAEQVLLPINESGRREQPPPRRDPMSPWRSEHLAD